MEDYSGRKLGKYTLEQRLGSGGMATVYRSTHPQLNRPVAIKILPLNDHIDEGFRNRFMREAQVMASLNHPTLIRIYDIDQEQNLFYMVMDLVQGGSLEERLRSGRPMGLFWTGDVIARVAEALDVAHQKGIIHRDIKPANILLTSDDNPVIADFGIAKMLEQDSAEITSAGTIIGTPLYMAPEQIRGDHVDGRADLYSLGIVFYQLLTGRTPFSGDTLTVITKQLHDPPPSLRVLTPDLPAPLETVVLRVLNKNPDQRYANGKEFANAIREALRSITPSEVVRIAPIVQEMPYLALNELPQHSQASPVVHKHQNPADTIKMIVMVVVLIFVLIFAVRLIRALLIPAVLIGGGFAVWYWYQQQAKDKAHAALPPSPTPALPQTEQTVSPLQYGVNLYRDGQYPEALATFNNVLEKNTGNVDALISRGLLYYSLDDLPHALDDFNAALAVNPRHSRALYQRALVYSALEQPAEAKTDLEQLMALLPSTAQLRDEAEARLNSLNDEVHTVPITGKLNDDEEASPSNEAETMMSKR